MYTDKISDMIAHFIGFFDTEVEEARMRTHYAQGHGLNADAHLQPHDDVANPFHIYDIALEDYDPGVRYRAGDFDFTSDRARHGMSFEDAKERLAKVAAQDVVGAHYRMPGQVDEMEEQPQLVLYSGPGSVIAHVSQMTLLQDDDYINMTDGPITQRDTTFVAEKTMEFYDEADRFTPFADYDRTDTYEGLQAISTDLHDFITHARDNDVSSLGTGADQDVVIASHSMSGTYVNGHVVNALPDVDDYMPDRGIAKPPVDPEESDTPQQSEMEPGNSLDVAAGANVVANIVSVVNTGVMTPVMAVMGNYHQVDAITQSYVYSDRDDVDASFSRENHGQTVANNIADFQRTDLGESADTSEADTEAEGETEAPMFPTAWRVSYVEGDVSFVHWIEQYHFVSDNDTLTVTLSGVDISVLTGGNGAVNLASFLGLGLQYDLVIVGGNVLDMNMIAQIAILYDNDTVRALDGASTDASVQSGNNLLWNEASIHNVGALDRFEDMPDYMVDTAKAINERDPNMPEGLATDPNFAGYAGLNVLYISGNLYDVTYIKQVSVLGDSDDVTQAAAKLLTDNEDASVAIDTGSNAVINIAQITDYDSFGGSTYVAGQLYSDAVLIQGGLVDVDGEQTPPAALANEVIAFLHDDTPIGEQSETIISSGHDLSWSQAHPVDVMQTAVA